MPLVVNGTAVKTNKEGFLLNADAWTVSVGEKLCEAHGVIPTDGHWEIINLLRQYCAEGNDPPSMRILVKEVRERLTPEKARSIYLMKLFGSSPAKMAARLAGLPKPKNCL